MSQGSETQESLINEPYALRLSFKTQEARKHLNFDLVGG